MPGPGTLVMPKTRVGWDVDSPGVEVEDLPEPADPSKQCRVRAVWSRSELLGFWLEWNRRVEAHEVPWKDMEEHEDG